MRLSHPLVSGLTSVFLRLWPGSPPGREEKKPSHKEMARARKFTIEVRVRRLNIGLQGECDPTKRI
jgi:hypothetical protein